MFYFAYATTKKSAEVLTRAGEIPRTMVTSFIFWAPPPPSKIGHGWGKGDESLFEWLAWRVDTVISK